MQHPDPDATRSVDHAPRDLPPAGRQLHERHTRRSATGRSRQRDSGTDPRPRAVVPASVWPPEQPVDPDDAWPEPILTRIVKTLSAPGQAIALLTDQASSADPPGHAYGTAARAVVPPGTLAAARELVEAHERRPRIAHWSPRSAGTAEPFWARFVHPTGPRNGPAHNDEAHGDAPRLRSVPAPFGDLTESVPLVIAAIDPAGAGDDFGFAAADLLRDGGTLAVITHCDRRQGRLVDPSGSIVASAQNADLLYLQHIVALHHPIAAGHLTRTRPGRTGASRRRRRVHSDVYLFGWHGQQTAELTEQRAA